MSDSKVASKRKNAQIIEERKETDKGWEEIEGLFQGKKSRKRQKHEEVLKGQAIQAEKKHRKAMKISSKKFKDEWVDDGLGGVYNSEGFTGRVEDGVKVFKAHILRKPNSGNTPDCPFDCDCCFI